ncbi:MAG: hypothetical protein ACO3RS_05195, partial [Candidatus Puniceispirillaceae bacterium]
MTRDHLFRRLFAEWFGTLALVATVVGSGIMAETLANNNLALALLGNTIATGAILVVLITMGHFLYDLKIKKDPEKIH